jgi:hypothetical protein
VRCTACGSDNPVGHRFCEECGSPLEQRCPQCGGAVRAGARFCGACGHRLAPEPSPVASPAPSPAAAAPAAPSRGAPPPEFRPYTPRHLADKILTVRSALEG